MIPRKIQTLVADDLSVVNQLIHQQICSKVPLIQNVCEYIVNNGGKRVRPLLVILCAKSLTETPTPYQQLAMIIELIHTATLLHDDIVDHSTERRGQPTANIKWDNPTAVLCGDYLFSRAFELMVQLSRPRATQLLVSAVNCITEGELIQLAEARDIELTEEKYFRVIYQKTAKLFETACQIPAVLAEAPAAMEQAMIDYGRHLGMAFQIIDDMLDYCGDYQLLGKHLGQDFAQGQLTLPLIYAISNSSTKDSQFIRQLLVEGDLKQLPLVSAIIQQCGALDYAKQKAKQEVELAQQSLNILPDSHYRDALGILCDTFTDRIM